MVKRHLAGLIVAAVIAGGGAVAMASAAPESTGGTSVGATSSTTAPARPSKEQVQKCREEHQAGQPPSAECQKLREQAKNRGQAKNRPGGALLRRTVHGDLIVRGKDGTFENITVDKGTVQSKGDKSLTLKRDDGKTVTVKVDDATKYRGVGSFAAIETGKPAIVVSHDGTARLVGQRAPGGNNARGSNVGGDEEQVPAT
jgi:hypothetical protein